jgi:hypothetical protein
MAEAFSITSFDSGAFSPTSFAFGVVVPDAVVSTPGGNSGSGGPGKQEPTIGYSRKPLFYSTGRPHERASPAKWTKV